MPLHDRPATLDKYILELGEDTHFPDTVMACTLAGEWSSTTIFPSPPPSGRHALSGRICYLRIRRFQRQITAKKIAPWIEPYKRTPSPAVSLWLIWSH